MKAIEWLYSLEGRGSVLGLDRIKELLQKIGNPEKNLKCIHVAGTNGKGSVCAIISSIMTEAGYKTGMYTSPHLKRFNERMQINGAEITDERLNELTEKIKPFSTDQTFFEVTTAMAFEYFSLEKVDIAIIEVGIGGRLDATNVITPLVSVITEISLEHTEILGDSEEKIAAEKAGIIKQNIPVVTHAKNGALKVIREIAKKNNSDVLIPEYSIRDGTLSINPYKNLQLGVKGEYQFINSALAIKAIQCLKGFAITESAIRKGLISARWPGRFEFIDKNVLVDCGHNLGGILALKKEIINIRKNFEKVISVVGILKDKDRKQMIDLISSFSDYIIFCKPNTERASEPEELQKMCSIKNEIVTDVKKALKKAKKIAYPEDLIIVTGSIYAIGEIL